MTRLVLPILGIAMGSLAITSSANAQGFEVAQKYSDLQAAPTVVISRPEIIADALLTFEIKKPVIQDTIKRELGRPNMIGSGISLYALNPRVGTASFKFLSVNSFEINVTDNYLYFRSTQPTDLGSWADPAAEVHFDIRVRGTMHLPTKETPKLAVIDATISVPKITIKGRNVVTDVALAFANVSDFFVKQVTGRSMIQSAFDRYLRMQLNDEINKELGPINKQITALAKKGFSPSYSLNGQILRITMTGDLFKGPNGVTSKASDAAKVLNSDASIQNRTLGKRKKSSLSTNASNSNVSTFPQRPTGPRPRGPEVPNVLNSDSAPVKADAASIQTRTLDKRKKPTNPPILMDPR